MESGLKMKESQSYAKQLQHIYNLSSYNNYK